MYAFSFLCCLTTIGGENQSLKKKKNPTKDRNGKTDISSEIQVSFHFTNHLCYTIVIFCLAKIIWDFGVCWTILGQQQLSYVAYPSDNHTIITTAS